MKLAFYIIFSLLSNSGKTDFENTLDQFNRQSITYFQELCFDKNIESPFKKEELRQFSRQVQDTDEQSYSILLANHLLFRYFLTINEMETAYQHGIRSLELSEQINDDALKQEIRFIGAYYSYYARRFDTWMSLKHLFRGVRSNPEKGLTIIFDDLNIESELYQLNLTDQYQIQYNQLFDYNAAIHTLNSLLVIASNKKQIFKQIAEMYYKSGAFEQAISIYQQIASDQSLSEQAELTERIISCYFYMAEFDISKQYIKRYLSSTVLERKPSILEIIVQIEMAPDRVVTDSVLNSCISNYQLNISLDELKSRITLPLSHFNLTDLYLNRKNLHVAEKRIAEMRSNSDSLFTVKQFSYAKLYWAKQDYFNSKRYLHNIINKYQSFFSRQMWVQANYILANIAFESNDFEQSKNYLEAADPEFLYFYQLPKFNFLQHHFKSN
ncbi:MAG: hypothetical protein KDD94_01955 [Calditrichaeota bacterium]|nr:hypothetical protein [Calditrichota bacterium]